MVSTYGNLPSSTSKQALFLTSMHHHTNTYYPAANVYNSITPLILAEMVDIASQPAHLLKMLINYLFMAHTAAVEYLMLFLRGHSTFHLLIKRHSTLSHDQWRWSEDGVSSAPSYEILVALWPVRLSERKSLTKPVSYCHDENRTFTSTPGAITASLLDISAITFLHCLHKSMYSLEVWSR